MTAESQRLEQALELGKLAAHVEIDKKAENPPMAKGPRKRQR